MKFSVQCQLLNLKFRHIDASQSLDTPRDHSVREGSVWEQGERKEPMRHTQLEGSGVPLPISIKEAEQ